MNEELIKQIIVSLNRTFYTELFTGIAIGLSVLVAIGIAFRLHLWFLPLRFRIFFSDTLTIVISGDQKIWKLQLPLSFTSLSPHSVVVQKCILELNDQQENKTYRMRWRLFVKPDFVLSEGGAILGKIPLREPSPFYVQENKSELMNIEFICPEEINFLKGHNYQLKLKVWHTTKSLKKSTKLRKNPELIEIANFYFSDFNNKAIKKEISLMQKEIDNAKKQGIQDLSPSARLIAVRIDEWCENWEKNM